VQRFRSGPTIVDKAGAGAAGPRARRLVPAAERQGARRLRRPADGFTGFWGPMRAARSDGNPADAAARHLGHNVPGIVATETPGRTGIAGVFIGDTAETVFDRDGCSALTVTPKGFVSPVTLDGADR
jgi:universal stress protein E